MLSTPSQHLQEEEEVEEKEVEREGGRKEGRKGKKKCHSQADRQLLNTRLGKSGR
jgi:hypothetical protein